MKRERVEKSRPKTYKESYTELPPVRRDKRKTDKLREEILNGLDELDEMIRRGD